MEENIYKCRNTDRGDFKILESMLVSELSACLWRDYSPLIQVYFISHQSSYK